MIWVTAGQPELNATESRSFSFWDLFCADGAGVGVEAMLTALKLLNTSTNIQTKHTSPSGDLETLLVGATGLAGLDELTEVECCAGDK
jgi:hypothetical protein